MLWFGIHKKVLNFHDWTLWYHKLFHDNRKRQKLMKLSMDLWHSNNMKVILHKRGKYNSFQLWAVDYGNCIPFSGIDFSIWLTIKPDKLRKFYSRISEKQIQTSIFPVFLSICPSDHPSVTHFTQDLQVRFS